ncbi:MAG: hypothetical protein NTW79_01520 [Candidatus Berkelbacteria bacterium]|nr:hypothetical protein [Candidatus Berkelbacteria bacterium]
MPKMSLPELICQIAETHNVKIDNIENLQAIEAQYKGERLTISIPDPRATYLDISHYFEAAIVGN